jgi:hypothetical protein
VEPRQRVQEAIDLPLEHVLRKGGEDGHIASWVGTN